MNRNEAYATSDYRWRVHNHSRRFFLASAILPDFNDDPTPSDVNSDGTMGDSNTTLEMRAAALWQEYEMRELQCAPIEADLEELMAESRICETASDCVLISMGCPFGCTGAYNKAAESVIIEAEDSFQSQCHHCVYHCPAPFGEFHAECKNNKCQVIDRSRFHMQPYAPK